MSFDWHRRHHADMIEIAAKVGHEAFGPYCILVDQLHLHNRPLVDDDRRIAGLLGMDVRKWRATRARLLAHDAIVIHDGRLDDVRAMSARSARDVASARATSAGHRGGIASAKTRKSNNLAEAKLKQRRGEERR